MPRKRARTAVERFADDMERRSTSLGHFAELYPSFPARLRQMLATADPAMVEKIKGVAAALMDRDWERSDWLSKRFGLTPAQAKVALHIAGRGTVAEYAKESGLSEQTVRTHLKAVFVKTGVTRQAELARILARR